MNIQEQYLKRQRKRLSYMGILLFIFLVAIDISLIITLKVGPFEPVQAVINYFTQELWTSSHREVDALILVLRMPRTLLCIVCGFALGIAGYVMQALSRNDLVSPFTVGISAASAFGASTAFLLGITYFAAPTLFAFGASLVCLFLVYLITRYTKASAARIVLVGIALNYLFSAGTEMLKFFAKHHQTEAILQWSFGNLNRANWELLLGPLVITVIVITLLSCYTLTFEIMATNSNESAQSLGINVKKTMITTGGLAVFMTAAVISVTGVIGFIGLIAPHMARLFYKGYNGFSFWAAGLMGATLLLIADTLGRVIMIPSDIPAGVIVSFIGVPLFIHMLWKERF